MKQLTHYNIPFKKQTFPITLVCDNITNAPNVGSLFRTADAFGVERIIFCGSPIPMGRKMTKTARATEKVVPFEVSENIEHTLKELEQENYTIAALEITSTSSPLSNLAIHNQPIALVIGDENFGVSKAALNLCHAVYHIDMFGQNSSMNVVQATGIACYVITQKLLGK
ncbi:RNA methyltransferase [Mangrovimonas yunxiaonensis]|uniref:RNA methyltransferase n=1 Tax=Mangrovimonas yunxiaonensis TaxID=1197477 RepID=A0A084THL4_9FLAO|nr:TrmH family RNA methyltransferase [Mangrovimonas yunxiaonensis]KFB00200.1 RNA methyltransferase [Mangrovimonas yunxiaonensis]GGH42485.1 RNA methyltransferase [Mangrovimonas yunxiaonensis]